MALLSASANDSRAVANKFLELVQGRGKSLTIMQMVKLIYFAQGWHLAFMDTPLTFHAPQAWKYGPVYPLVYKAYPDAGSRPLSDAIMNSATDAPYSATLTSDETDLLNWVLDNYGSVHAFDLSNLTHAEDGPWKYVVDNLGLYKDIPDSLMKSYFKKFLKDDAK